MAINLIYQNCATNLSVRSKICKNCGYEFKNGRKYRVVVKDKNGKRVSKVLDSAAMANHFFMPVPVYPVVPVHHVVIRTRIFYSQGSRHRAV